MEQRWLYGTPSGRRIWLAFDPKFPCIYCDRPVHALSAGGPAVCPECDCGYHKGEKWTPNQAMNFYQHSWARLEALPDDPAWKVYDQSYREAEDAKRQGGVH